MIGEAYTAAVESHARLGARGSSRVQTLMRQAPRGAAGLADYFGGLASDDLATCWVALVLDALVGLGLGDLSGGELAEVARALTVVAERMHRLPATAGPSSPAAAPPASEPDVRPRRGRHAPRGALKNAVLERLSRGRRATIADVAASLAHLSGAPTAEARRSSVESCIYQMLTKGYIVRDGEHVRLP